MICKSVGVKSTCMGILQLFRLFPTGSAAGALLPLTGKTCRTTEKSCLVWGRTASVLPSSWSCYKARRNLLLIFQECFGQATPSASLPWAVEGLTPSAMHYRAFCVCSGPLFSRWVFLQCHFNEAQICK